MISHSLLILGALTLTVLSVYVIQIFTYTLGGPLWVVFWAGLILYAFMKPTTR